jgi:PHD/YefM family antitoxin component YafN of YafNO toxin-antitoxin module
MLTLTANDAKRKPVKISKNSKDTVVVMSIRDYEEIEAMKAEYIKHCFESAKQDLAKGNVLDGQSFLNAL